MRLHTLILGGLALTGLITGCAQGEDASLDPADSALELHTTADGDEFFETCGDTCEASDRVVEERAPAPIAVLSFDNGYELSFVELVGSDGVRGVGVAEAIPENLPPAIAALGLQDASPLEIFYAFSNDKRHIPDSLVELYNADGFVFQRDRGWGSAQLSALQATAALTGDVACSDSWFQNWVNDSLPSDTWRLNHNGTEGNWSSYCDYSIPAFNGCGNCYNATRKKYEHVVYNVDEWRAYSCLNSSNNHLWACSSGSGELYLRVSYMYRDSNNNGWYTAFISPNAEYVGQNRAYSWHWNTGSNWDWMHTVRGAPTTGVDHVDLYTGWRS